MARTPGTPAAYPEQVLAEDDGVDASRKAASEGTVEPFAMRDLDRALARGCERHGHLLSAGEWVVVRQLQACSTGARSLYARLFGRKDRFLATEELDYPDVDDIDAAVQELAAAGLARTSAGLCTPRELLPLHPMPGLRQVCRALGLPRSGRRSALEERLVRAPGAQALLLKPAVRLAHRGLVRRLCRAWLVDHAGDLSALVLARMDVVKPPPHPVTGGPGLHPSRRALQAYEAALRRWGKRELDCEAECEAALAVLRDMPPPDPARARFSPLPFALRVVTEAARGRERQGEPGSALAVYDEALASVQRLGMAPPPELVRRRALCLDRLGDAAAGARACAAALDAAPPSPARALARTGRRLAKRGGAPWRPLPPLRAPRPRTLTLPPSPGSGRRPRWRVAGEARVAEGAVAAALVAAGRRVVHTENAPWTSLFALLLWDVLFAPVHGMLPGPGMHRPLDLGLPGFAARRSTELEAALAPLSAGHGPAALDAALEAHGGEAIAGLRWHAGLPTELRALVRALPGPALAGILRAYADHWRDARAGMPDLLLLPGAACRVEGAFPGRIPEDTVFIEVKGPTDSLRDGQRIWLDRLQALGLRAELWTITPSAPSGSG